MIILVFGDKAIEFGAFKIDWVGDFLVKFGDDYIGFFTFFGDWSLKCGDIWFTLVMNKFIAKLKL